MNTPFGPAAAAGSRSVKVKHPSYPDISIGIMNAIAWLKAAFKAHPERLPNSAKNQLCLAALLFPTAPPFPAKSLQPLPACIKMTGQMNG